ncbi:unnamed protein product [Nesidiocoris tenuis]|uniref:Uncharacterized protein n=1 Tax=Nesidiocoris tenuis TaxID=355587 RepID=A0A6H5HG21_9HEMI|nr:unnamed protein product [Nesidiocoris tenuis]
MKFSYATAEKGSNSMRKSASNALSWLQGANSKVPASTPSQISAITTGSIAHLTATESSRLASSWSWQLQSGVSCRSQEPHIRSFFSAGDSVQSGNSCDDWPDSKGVCGGGVLALNGKTGTMLWRYWTRKDILFVDCSANLNADSTKDCLISGKGGVRHLIILSGRGGDLLGQFRVPDNEGLFTAPRILVARDGTDTVIFASGAYDTPGAIYSVPLSSIAKSLTEDSGVRKIWDGPTGVGSGFVLADMTGDGYDDIIVTLGDTLIVLNSNNFSLHWNVSSYSGAAPDQKQQIIVFPINVNLGDSAIEYNMPEPAITDSKLSDALEGRNERRTVRSLADGGARSLPRASSTASFIINLDVRGCRFHSFNIFGFCPEFVKILMPSIMEESQNQTILAND